jgi:hypothetical protein
MIPENWDYVLDITHQHWIGAINVVDYGFSMNIVNDSTPCCKVDNLCKVAVQKYRVELIKVRLKLVGSIPLF